MQVHPWADVESSTTTLVAGWLLVGIELQCRTAVFPAKRTRQTQVQLHSITCIHEILHKRMARCLLTFSLRSKQQRCHVMLTSQSRSHLARPRLQSRKRP